MNLAIAITFEVAIVAVSIGIAVLIDRLLAGREEPPAPEVPGRHQAAIASIPASAYRASPPDGRHCAREES